MALKKDDWALGVSVLALLVAGASLYFSELSRADVSVAVGHDVLITKTTNVGPRIGVISSFVNGGARQTIITNATLDLESPKVTLPLAWVGESFGGWEESEGVFKPSAAKYNLAAPIPVKGHDTAAAIFWFVPTASFELTPGRHEFTLSVTSQDGNWKRHFAIDISPTEISNINKSPYSDHAISVVEQH